MPDHSVSPARALDAAIFHGHMVADAPFAGGPFPPEILRTLAEAASEQVNVHALMHTPGYTLAERERAVAISLASMWAAGFKSGVQAAAPDCGVCEACLWSAVNGDTDEVTGRPSRPACTGAPSPKDTP